MTVASDNMAVIDELRGQVALMLTVRRECWDTLMRNIAAENIIYYRSQIEAKLREHLKTLPDPL